jgi:hypothetical protein
MTQDNVLDKYKQAYGDTMSDEKLKEYVYYQKLIHDAKSKQKKLIKQEGEEIEITNDDQENDKKLKKRKNRVGKKALNEEVIHPQS